MENNFLLDLIASLKKTQSQKQVKEDIRALGEFKLPLIGTLNKAKTKSQIKQDLSSLNGTVSLTGKVDNKRIATSMKQATAQAQRQADTKPVEISFSVKKEKLLNDIKLLAKENSKLFKDNDMSIKYNSLLDSAEMARNTVELSNLRTQLGSLRSELKITGNAGLTMTDALKNGLSKVLQLFGSYGIITQFTAQLRNSWEEAKELDKSMTDLSRVNSEITRSDFPDYLDRVIGKTKELSVATNDYIDAVTTFSRAGYNLTDSEILADMAVQLEKVGDMSAVDASKALLAGLQGYGEIDGYGMDQLTEKAQALNDKIDLIGNTASITQSEVAQGIQAVGSVMNDANTSIDEFIALLGAGNRAVQDSNRVALAIRTSTLRIRGCTAELQEMGEETDNVIESTSTLAEKIKALTNINGSGGVNILEADEETFRSIYDIYNDISKVYDKMSDKDASALLDLIAGKNRSNQISAILQNMSEANELLEKSLNATGTASAEYEIYLNSAQAATERFGVAMTETYSNIISGDTVKGVANAGAAVLDFANSWNILEGTIRGFLALGVLKGITTLTVAFKNSAVQISNYGSALEATKNLNTYAQDTVKYANAVDLLKTSCVNLTDAQLKQVLANRNLSNSQLVEILQLKGLEAEEQKARLAQLGLIQTTETQTVAQGVATASTFSLSAAMKGLGASIKAAFMANPIGVTIMGISLAFSVINTVISKYKESVVDAGEATKEAIETFESISSEVKSIEGKLSDLNDQIDKLNPITDAEDIENLQLETEELEKQLAILKEKQRIAGADADKAAQKSLGMTEASRYKTEERESAYGGVESGAAYVTKDEELQNAIDAYEEYKQKVDEANDALANMAETGEYTEKEWNEQEQIISEYSEKMDDARSHANELATTLEEQKQGLDGNTESSQAMLTKIEDVITEYENWLNEINGTTKALEEQVKVEKEVFSETPASPLSISETVDQLNNKLKPAMDSLNSAWNEIFTDDEFKLNSIDILSICDSIKSKLDDMKELGLDVDYSSYEDFIRVLNNSESEASDVDKAFDSLANSIAQAALTGAEDFRTMKAALEDLGVVNSDIIAFQSLINNTTALEEAVSQAGLTMDDFVVSTEDGSIAATDAARAFVEEMVGAENCQQALALLQLQQVLCNENSLNTTDDINACLTLAQAAGVAVSALSQLANVSAQYDRAVAAGDTVAQKNLAVTMESIKARINSEIANFKPMAVDFSGVGKNAKSAGSKAGKDYKDALKEQLSDLDSVIAGITSRIDDQISSINEQKSAALEAIDAEKESIESAKEAAVEALEAERDARLEVIETQKKQLEEQIKLIDKQIKQKQDEIDKINEAAEARAREISLQKAQYELEKAQNTRNKLVYSSDKGLHYEIDSKSVRDAKEKVDEAKRQIEIANIQKEIDLLEDQKDLLNEQIDLLNEQADAVNDYYDNLIKQTEAYYDQQLKNLEKQRKETEAFFDAQVKGLEQRKEKFQELTEILEKAELSAKLKQLGIDEEALLNGSEEEFEKLKNAYMDIVFQLNQGNDEVLNALRELSGYDGTAPAMLEDSNAELDTMNENLTTSNTNVGNVNSSLGETASTTATVASNVSDISTNLSEANGLVTEETTAFNNLKQAVDEVIETINQKTDAVKAEQEAVGIATSDEMANFLLLKEKILEVKETLESFGTQNEGIIHDIAVAIESLNEITLDDGLITQFNNLKEAIDSVTAAISGGGGESSEGEGSGSGSGSGKGGESGSKGSKGEGGSSNSLTGAIEKMGETAQEVIGEPDAEGDGTVIGEFGSMETAVNDVRDAIGTEGSEGQGGSSGGEGDDTLVGSIEYLGDKTEEEMGESGGDGIIGRFEEFRDVIGEAEEHVQGINRGLDEIDGKTVECTIKINIETSGGGLPGAIGAGMNLGSAQYDAKYLGNAHVEGSALASGNWAVQSDEKKALLGEVGYEIIVRNGRFFTVGDNGPEMFPIKKGDIVFNHEQSVELLKNGHTSGQGKAYADGTVGGGKVLMPGGRIFEPYDPDKDNSSFSKLYKAWTAYYGDIDKNVDEINKTLSKHLAIEHSQKMNKEVTEFVNTTSSVVNNNKNVQPIVNHISVSLPNVTNSTSAETLLRDLESLNTKKYQVDW